MPSENHRKNFETLWQAFQNKDAALLECLHAKTGKPVSVICTVNRRPNGLLEFVQFARMLDEPMGTLVFPSVPVDPTWSPTQN